MGAKNTVLAGAHQGKPVVLMAGQPSIALAMGVHTNNKDLLLLDKFEIEAYELITEEISKSAVSGVARGLVGGALLGPVGMLAGGLSAKNKGIYQLAIQFKNGDKSLVEVDEKIYKGIVRACF